MNETENLILRKQELEEEIIKLVNNANLPAFIIRPILNDLYNQVLIQEHQQLEMAKQSKKEEKEENHE